MSNSAPENLPSVDGRRARRDRNRETVVDALLELYREGQMAPSVARVAERSGVSHRSVFRYFEDLDELLAVAIERQAEAIAPLVEIDDLGSGPLGDRIESLVAQRLALYAEAAPVARVARMRAPLLPLVAEDLVRNRELLRRQVRAHFGPELAALDDPEPVYSAAAVLCSLESIELLRYDRGLSPDDAGAALRAGLTALFFHDHAT